MFKEGSLSYSSSSFITIIYISIPPSLPLNNPPKTPKGFSDYFYFFLKSNADELELLIIKRKAYTGFEDNIDLTTLITGILNEDQRSFRGSGSGSYSIVYFFKVIHKQNLTKTNL